jgi:chorismate mutase
MEKVMKKLLNLTPVNEWLKKGDKPVIISGPCSAESEEQMMTTAKAIAAIDKNIIFRAGIWKPRTRPNAFEGIGTIGLKWLNMVKAETGMLTATEIANASHAEEALKHGIDILWIGARTTVNPFSVQEIADVLKGTDSKVLVKNPINPDLQLWLGALERINQAGITKLGAIHRGFSTHESTPFRNVPRWEMAIELKTMIPDLPFICDPSHICGNTEFIPYISQKALDLDMQGLMIETHFKPSIALSDAKQQVTPAELKVILSKLVVRKPDSTNAEFINKLDELREAINKIDDQLLSVFMNRMSVVEKIGKYKKDNNVTILQTTRWEELLNDKITQAKAMGLDADFVKQLYILIHEDSIRKQTEIMNG